MRWAIAAVLTAVSVCAIGEEVQTADARTGTSDDGLYVVFVSKRVAADNPVGFAAMAACKGERVDALTIETAWGMTPTGDEPELGALTAADVEAVRASDEGETTRTFVVSVDRARYDSVVGHLSAFAARGDDPDLTPEAVLHESTRIVILSIGSLKEPYRGGGRRAPNTQTYYEDLMLLNRNK